MAEEPQKGDDRVRPAAGTGLGVEFASTRLRSSSTSVVIDPDRNEHEVALALGVEG